MAENPKLTVLFEKLRGKSFELNKDLISAGRGDGMGILIAEPSLSRHHCDFIRTERDTYIVRDNGSTNGTRVNNIPVTELELRDEDIVQLGIVELLYTGKEPAFNDFGGRIHGMPLF